MLLIRTEIDGQAPYITITSNHSTPSYPYTNMHTHTHTRKQRNPFNQLYGSEWIADSSCRYICHHHSACHPFLIRSLVWIKIVFVLFCFFFSLFVRHSASFSLSHVNYIIPLSYDVQAQMLIIEPSSIGGTRLALIIIRRCRISYLDNWFSFVLSIQLKQLNFLFLFLNFCSRWSLLLLFVGSVSSTALINCRVKPFSVHLI